MNRTIVAIIDFLEMARDKHGVPKEELQNGGSVYYSNGNDGTDFDWTVNNHLCEFGYGTADGSRWVFKLRLYRNGTAHIDCYPHGELMPVETLTRQLASEKDMEELYQLMMQSADEQSKWDCTLEELGLLD